MYACPTYVGHRLCSTLPRDSVHEKLFLSPLRCACGANNVAGGNLNKGTLADCTRKLCPSLGASTGVCTCVSFGFGYVSGMNTVPFGLFHDSRVCLVRTRTGYRLAPPGRTRTERLLGRLVHSDKHSPRCAYSGDNRTLLSRVGFCHHVRL